MNRFQPVPGSADEADRLDTQLEIEERDSASAFVKCATQQARLGFVRKVYGILAVQLCVTVVIAAYIAKTAVKMSPAVSLFILAGSAILSISTICIMTCCHETTRRFPTNYILLGVFTLAESVLIGFTCSRYPAPVVLGCAGLTAGMFVGLSIYAMTCAQDFTGFGPYLAAALISVSMFILGMATFSFFFPNAGAAFPIVKKILAGFMVMIFSFYIVYDTQLMIGNGFNGKEHKQQFELDDYVIAALNLYLDIVNLFLYLLELFGSRDDE